jgi:hypothetical protein
MQATEVSSLNKSYNATSCGGRQPCQERTGPQSMCTKFERL